MAPTRYERARRAAYAIARVPARGDGFEDADRSEALRAFSVRHILVTDSSISPTDASITDFPAISILLAGHARLATPFHTKTLAVSPFSIPITQLRKRSGRLH